MSTITETLQRDFEFLRSRLSNDAEIVLVVSRYHWERTPGYGFTINRRWIGSSNTYEEAFGHALESIERLPTSAKTFAIFGLTSDGHFLPETSA